MKKCKKSCQNCKFVCSFQKGVKIKYCDEWEAAQE